MLTGKQTQKKPNNDNLFPLFRELYSRERLDSFLSRALDIPLDENHRLTAIDDSAYVLTLDFAIKMLNIHERAECQIPVIIEGETGVGKTALVEMLSKLWNYSLIKSWNVQKERLLEYITRKLAGGQTLTCRRLQGQD